MPLCGVVGFGAAVSDPEGAVGATAGAFAVAGGAVVEDACASATVGRALPAANARRANAPMTVFIQGS